MSWWDKIFPSSGGAFYPPTSGGDKVRRRPHVNNFAAYLYGQIHLSKLSANCNLTLKLTIIFPGEKCGGRGFDCVCISHTHT